MTNQDILKIAMQQSAIDSNCKMNDFLQKDNVVVVSCANEKARKYLDLPFACDLVSYGNNIVASVNEEVFDSVRKYIDRYPVEHCFETPNLHVLNDELQKYGLRICFMAEHFLPNVDLLKPVSCKYEMKTLYPAELASLFRPEWSNALCEKRKSLNLLGVGAYDGEKLIGLAGSSADCDSMWQIGIDVLPQYRGQSIACALTSRLALEILDRGKVPFYCAAWSNIKSVKNAIKSGFRPSWVEITAKSCDFVVNMNGKS